MDGIVEQVNSESSRRSAVIEYNIERDLPLMAAVRNATFIAQEQLWEEMEAAQVERSRRSFNWRLQRLTEAGLVNKLPPRVPYRGAVYAISRPGLECIEACGQGLVSLSSDSRSLVNPNQVQHYLELAEVRRALRRGGVLREWTGDVELRSINFSIECPLAKDYDAIADLKIEDKCHRVAIEYERTLKSAERYRNLSAALENEDQVEILLYLTSSLDLLYQLIGHFSEERITIAVAPSRAFCDNPVGCRLHLVGQTETTRTTLSALLQSSSKLATRR
jgi:hypothetical protein